MIRLLIRFLPQKSSFFIFALVLINLTPATSQIPVVTNEGYILMDEDGDIYTKGSYEFIGNEHSDSHIFFDNGKFGYLSDIGRILITPQYDIAYPFKGDFALVGKDEKYYYINKTNIVLDTLDQPYAPKVIKDYFLLINNENTSHIAFRNGDTIYHTKDLLFLTKKSGLIEWNKKHRKVALLRPSYYKKAVMPIRELKSIDSLMITREGYLITFHKEEGNNVFTVLDNAGRDLIVKEATTEIDYKSIKVFGIMIYIPSKSDYLFDEYSDYGYGSKYYWDTDQMYYTQINQRVPHSLYLGYNYVNELVARIKGSEKYVPFSGSKLEGNKLFDEIGTKGRDYLPVRIKDDWFLWSRRKDTLIPVNFRHIHKIGVHESTYFGSNNEKTWALVNFETGSTTEEKYILPKNNPLFRSNWVSLYENKPNPYVWEKNMVRVKEGKAYHILNLNGKRLLTENSEKYKRIESFIKDTFNFRGKQLPLTKDLKKQFDRNKISVRLFRDKDDITLYFTNRTKQDQELGYSGYYEIILEAKNKDGVWKSISKFGTPFGVDNNMGTSLLKGHYVQKNLPKFSGNFKTQLRAVFTYQNNQFTHKVVSNEIEVSINEAKFWVDRYYHLYGIE